MKILRLVSSPRALPSFLLNAFLGNVFFLLLVTSTTTTTTNAQYLVEILERAQLGGHRPVVRCEATGANFGDDVITFSFGMSAIGCALPTEPAEACGNITKPDFNATAAHCFFDFAVVPRGNCTFSEKAYFAQNALPSGYAALILFAAKGQSPIPMSGSKFADQVKIPVVMVNYGCMQSLLYGPHTARHGYVVTIKASPGYYDLIKYLVPFVAIVGICFVVLFISLMIRLCRERRRLARKRLPRSYLKKIPTKKYRKGDPEETCAICLEDFQEGEKLRVLPCRHAYHCKCIDPWLTKNRKVCPVCKRRVGPRNSDSSDTDETDAERTSSTTTAGAGRRTVGMPIIGASVVGGGAPSGSSSALGALLSSRDNDPLLSNAQPPPPPPAAQTSPPPIVRRPIPKMFWPLPPHLPQRVAPPTLSSAPQQQILSISAAFSTVCGQKENCRGASSPSSAASVLPTVAANVSQQHNNNNNSPLDSTNMAHHQRAGDGGGGAPLEEKSTATNGQQQMTPSFVTTELGDHVGDVQQQQRSNAATTATTSPLMNSFVRSSLAGMRNRLTNLISRRQRSDGSNPPHTLLENEEDSMSSTTLTSASRGGEETDTLSHRTCDTFDEPNNGSASIDGHSMTTMHSSSNRHSVVPPPPVSAFDLSSCSNRTGTVATEAQQLSSSTSNNNNNEFKQLSAGNDGAEHLLQQHQ